MIILKLFFVSIGIFYCRQRAWTVIIEHRREISRNSLLDLRKGQTEQGFFTGGEAILTHLEDLEDTFHADEIKKSKERRVKRCSLRRK